MIIQDLTEIFINIPDENYDADDYENRVLAAIDRDDVHGVMMSFTQGISLFIENIDNSDLDMSEYEAFVIEKLETEFGDEIGEIEFIF
ncbi:hypothetical protein VPFG_00146 [Vibrio phage nt-1]|uniref:Uncharacterized protein n=1 Tax=Vibrio phage nt-1 TaxID=115992 RepID=R9TGC9_9CAUD|nr:hypothetical protein VPFG_00146 [Vibrio phage nt-1]AGN30148.1 hypothetical protein VPFG_00146 [Vibrio phage nt-1]